MRLAAKEYFSSPSDKLAVYNSDPEDNNVEHSHEFDELVIVKSGHGLHVIHNQPLFIKNGDVFFVKKDEYHFYDELGTLKLINILINPEADFHFLKNIDQLLCRLTSNSLDDYAWLDNTALAQVIDIADTIFYKMMTMSHQKEKLALQQESLFLTLVTLILDHQHADNTSNEHKINKILKYVQSDCFSDINWHALSEQYQVPLRTLFRQLKEKTGMTPDNYLKRLRLISARKKIRETDISITNIAFDCGFSNSNHFATAYKSVFGISPSTERTNYSHSI